MVSIKAVIVGSGSLFYSPSSFALVRINDLLLSVKARPKTLGTYIQHIRGRNSDGKIRTGDVDSTNTFHLIFQSFFIFHTASKSLTLDSAKSFSDR